MTNCGRITAVVVALLLAFPSAMPGATPQQVEIAIARGKEWLYAQQNERGTWDQAQPGPNRLGIGEQWGGYTALVTYALLASGESAQEPRLQKAIEFLLNTQIDGVYSIGMRANVWGYLPRTDAVRGAMARDRDYLLNAVRQRGAGAGMFDYHPYGPEGRFDISVSQYGVLGAFALSQSGVELPIPFWRLMDEGWRRQQYADGSWSYMVNDGTDSDRKPSAAMTAAGIASQFIIQDILHAASGVDCRGNINNPSIDKGLEWMAANFQDIFTGDRIFYGLYGLERIGVASGRKYFGSIDWYQTGADYLVRNQREDGRWDTGSAKGGSLAETSWAVLFLVRGRAPVVLNKLQYDILDRAGKPTPGHWNQRPRDAANVTRWVGRQLERDLNWQVVSLEGDVNDWHDAPILYIAGNQAIAWTDAQKSKLRSFVHQGGLILGHADCSSDAFARSFAKLGAELFPSYEFRRLPQDHVLFTRQMYPASRWRVRPEIQGLSNGARELMLLIPRGDPARSWQSRQIGGNEMQYQLLANIVLYSADKQNLKFKGDTHVLIADVKKELKATVTVARLRYDGNWDPEPGGWRRLHAYMTSRKSVGVETREIPLGEGKLAGFKIAHLTGTATPSLAEPQIDELKKFIDGGGVLVIDAAGGNADFASAMERMLATMFPEETRAWSDPISKDDALFSTTGGEVTGVRFRAHALSQRTNLGTAPRLRALRINGRLAVVFSAEDLSAGLVGQNVDGIVGYEPSTATELMARILLFGSGLGKSGENR